MDKDIEGLVLVNHVVGGVTVTLPRIVKPAVKGAKAGIAAHVFGSARPYLAPDTSKDALYTRYLIDVGAIAAAPVVYQKRAIGVLTVSTRDQHGSASASRRAARSRVGRTLCAARRSTASPPRPVDR